MNYELAKKLKEADFPYSESSYKTVYPEGMERPRYSYLSLIPASDKGMRLPTLSELIEACALPLTYFSLEQHSNDWRAGFLSESYKKERKVNHCRGRTPEEAVANLWLELNKR